MEYECKQVPVILYIPDNTVKLTITAKVLDEDDNFAEVVNKMGVAEVADARIDGVEWEDENVKYVLTDKAKEELYERDKGQA